MQHDTIRIGRRLLDILCCSKDGAGLVLDTIRDTSAGEILSLVCPQCEQRYPVHDGIPRFVGSDEYACNFSHEWTVHRTTQLDTDAQRLSEATFIEKTGWTAEDIRGKMILDVGCGMGRYADVVLKWGGEVVGLDLSFAVDSAQKNLGSTKRFHAVQASVFDMPFKPESFDLIYSIGVLHHTPDCQRAFGCLPRLLRPGGGIAIWVYSAHSYPQEGAEERRDRWLRRHTTKMSARHLHALCRLLCRLPLRPRSFWHMVLPGILFHAIPRLHHEYRDYQWRVLDTFDWYSSVYQSKHSYPEVCRWFREAGLVEIVSLDTEVSVRGRRSIETGTDAKGLDRCAESLA